MKCRSYISTVCRHFKHSGTNLCGLFKGVELRSPPLESLLYFVP